MEYSIFAKHLESVQRVALIGINGALRPTPTLALDAILHIAPADIAGKCIVAKVAIRLREAGHIKSPIMGHLLPSRTSISPPASSTSVGQ